MTAVRRFLWGAALWALALPLAAQTPVEAEVPSAPAAAAASDPVPPPPAGGVAIIPDAPAAIGPANGADEELRAYIDGLMASLRREHRLPGLTLAVVRHDTQLLAQGYGLADVAGAQAVGAESTLFRIGSVSKTFIWTTVMMLVERGQLDLDADVNRYLKTVRVAEAFGVPVTMRQLMHHRAGFEDSLRLFAVSDSDTRTLAELLAAQQPARVYAPGLRTSYSNWGSALAAQIVADISGREYAEFLRAEILDPLAMHATTFAAPSRLDEATRARLATGYKDDAGALGVQDYMQLGAYWPAGGIASTATDMARWMRFHLNGGVLDGVRLMRAETHAQMWTRGFTDRPGAADLAHGFQDRSYRGLRVLGHGGATAAFYTNMVLVPELGLGVFVSQNSRQTRLSVSQLPELIIDRVQGSSYQPELAVESAGDTPLAELAGSYLQNRRVFSSFAAILTVDGTSELTPLAADALLLSEGDQSTQYRRVGQERDLYEAADGGRIAFIREGDRVVALADSTGVHTLEKVDLLHNPTTALAALGAALLLALATMLGFWWRLGRGPGHGQGAASVLAATVDLLSALCVLGFAVVTVRMVIAISGLDSAELAANYPHPSMLHVHYAGWVLAGAAGALWLTLIPAWRADGWGLWRRLRYSLWTLTLTFAVYLLWQWKVYAAPVY